MNLSFGELWRNQAVDMPTPNVEWRFDTVRKWRFDYAWPVQKVAVEIDGGQWRVGGGRHNTDADREKLNSAACAGWCVLRFSTHTLEVEPLTCVMQTYRALEMRMEKGARE
jgi:very-short-patch-repair endonuclease